MDKKTCTTILLDALGCIPQGVPNTTSNSGQHHESTPPADGGDDAKVLHLPVLQTLLIKSVESNADKPILTLTIIQRQLNFVDADDLKARDLNVLQQKALIYRVNQRAGNSMAHRKRSFINDTAHPDPKPGYVHTLVATVPMKNEVIWSAFPCHIFKYTVELELTSYSHQFDDNSQITVRPTLYIAVKDDEKRNRVPDVWRMLSIKDKNNFNLTNDSSFISDLPVVDFGMEKKSNDQRTFNYWPRVKLSWYVSKKPTHSILNAVAPLAVVAVMSTVVFVAFMDSNNDFLTNILPVAASAIVLLPRFTLHHRSTNVKKDENLDRTSSVTPARSSVTVVNPHGEAYLALQSSQSQNPTHANIDLLSLHPSPAVSAGPTAQSSPNRSGDAPHHEAAQSHRNNAPEHNGFAETPVNFPHNPKSNVESGGGSDGLFLCSFHIDIANLTIFFVLVGFLLLVVSSSTRVAGLILVWLSVFLCMIVSPILFCIKRNHLAKQLNPNNPNHIRDFYDNQRNTSGGKPDGATVTVSQWVDISRFGSASDQKTWRLLPNDNVF